MIDKGLSLKDILATGNKKQVDTIPRDQFERGLKKIGYETTSTTIDKFMDLLADKKDIKLVNVQPLKDKIKKVGIRKPEQANACLQNMPQKVQMVLDNIQKYLVNKNISLPDFHKALDKNKDGQIQL